MDGDGYGSDVDCDNNNKGINPGATEVCNGVDDDCDGTTDESYIPIETSCGTGGCQATGYTSCVDGSVADSCTAGTAEVEICDGLDNDCDNEVDEDFTDDECQYVCEINYVWTNNNGNLNCCGDDANEDNPYETFETSCNDGNDNDCDGLIDLNDLDCVTCVDNDEDGYDAISGSCSIGIDCNDANANVNPSATEVCDGLDNNCDGEIDEEDICVSTCVSDTDCKADQFCEYTGCSGEGGTCVNVPELCTQEYMPVCGCNGATHSNDCYRQSTLVSKDYDGECNKCETDEDADGYLPIGCSDGLDCDDTTADINPGATEVCDSVDNDCDSQIDEGDVCSATDYYCDGDSDDFISSTITDSCSGPDCVPIECTETQGDDCNDADADINPGATEICDGVDNNCDRSVDEGVKNTYYEDSDSDDYGNNAVTTQACSAPAGYVNDNTDCDDVDSAINPGEAETCNDNIDNNCNGNIDEGCLADLEPTEITYYSWKEPIIAGMWIVFESGIQNTGTQDAENRFNVKWFLDDEEVRYGSHISIDAGQTIMDDNSVYVWNPAMPGTYTVKFVVNADTKHAAESDYTNNEIEIPVDIPENCKYFVTEGCDYIDLEAAAITYAGQLAAGTPVTFDSSMSNIGAMDSNAFNIKWFVDDEPVVYGSNGAIAAGATIENVATSYRWRNPTSGQHTITFDINVDKHFDEFDFGNNEQSIVVNVP